MNSILYLKVLFQWHSFTYSTDDFVKKIMLIDSSIQMKTNEFYHLLTEFDSLFEFI